jgi:hypothetical protein
MPFGDEAEPESLFGATKILVQGSARNGLGMGLTPRLEFWKQLLTKNDLEDLKAKAGETET